MKSRIVLLGPPASGKGTLADRLSREFDLPIVSPGHLLRIAKETATEAGLRADELTRHGALVDDRMINGIVAEWLDAQPGQGFIFDGYPRTVVQADALAGTLTQKGLSLDTAILLEADEAVLRHRVFNRLICRQCGNVVSLGLHVVSVQDPCPRCGGALSRRSDDTDETLTRRLVEYRAKTEPLVGYYEQKNLLRRVNADRLPEDVFKSALEILA